MVRYHPRSPLALGVLAFLAVKLLNLSLNLRWFPTLSPAPTPVPPPASGPSRTEQVALLVPVRDEVERLVRTLPMLLSATAGPIFFLDDQSGDGTADFIRQATSGDRRVQVSTGVERPPGWAGKTWACAQLADAALESGAEFLVFVDADVEMGPGAVDSVVAEMQRQRADVFSVFCRQLTQAWPERLLLPLIDDVVLCFLPHRLLTAPVPAAATATGALLAFTRGAYETLGGFAAVKAEVVEDVALARLTRRAGMTLGLALGGNQAQVRMYRSQSEITTGMGRGLAFAAGGRRSLLLIGWIWHLVAYTMPPLLAARSRWWGGAALLGITERILVEAKTGGRDWTAALAVAASPVAAVPVVVRALRRSHVWKGRVYR